MKQLIYWLLLFLLTGCSRFLEADLNKSEITTDKVFKNDVTATAAITGIYNTISNNSPLSGTASGMNALAALSAGEIYYYPQDNQTPDFKAFQQHQINPQNSTIERLWNGMYIVIYQANAVLEGIQGSSALSPGTAQQLQGEAHFIRAFVYFYLVNLFGDVPLVVQTDYRSNQNLSRRPAEEVFALIESDLLSAQTLLSADYVTPNRVRPNKATAGVLLARLYLYRKQYSQAEEEASSIIDDPVYKMTTKDNIDKTFLFASDETIWQLMPVIPYQNTAEGNTFIITTTPRSYVLADSLRFHFEPGDFRATHWMNSFTNERGTFYYPYKYKQRIKDPQASFTEYSVVFRLAEMYLIRAEARAHLNNTPDGCSDLNVIRTRAGLADTTIDNQPGLLLAIESERWSELFTEYAHRWLDLKRTGRALEVLGNGITTDDELYPLPAAEFIKNPNLGNQNQGY